jgi:hypothetical protein
VTGSNYRPTDYKAGEILLHRADKRLSSVIVVSFIVLVPLCRPQSTFR